MERRVNAVVLNYNQLDAALQAVAELTGSRGIDVDVVLVDAASAGHERDALRERIPADRLLLLPDNRGYAGGMNAGIEFWQERAPDAPVLLATPDARVAEDVALALWQGMQADESVGAAGPVIIYRDSPPRRIGAGGEVDSRRGRVRMLPEIRGATAYDVDWLEGCCILLRPRALRAVGVMDEEYFLYFEEIDLCHRLRQAGWRVRLVPTVSVRHPKAPGGLPAHAFYYMTRNAYRFWAKNFGAPTAKSALEILRSTLWLGTLAFASLLLPTRWNEAPARCRDLLMQIRGVWMGTRDHLSGTYGRGAGPTQRRN